MSGKLYGKFPNLIQCVRENVTMLIAQYKYYKVKVKGFKNIKIFDICEDFLSGSYLGHCRTDNKMKLTFLGSMLNFFLPIAICLFLCVVLLQMEVNMS